MSGPPGDRPVRIFLIAGEPSGDQLGARLIAGLRAEVGERLEIRGVGGPAMAAEGLESLVPIEDLSVMGLLEVLPHLPRLLRHLRNTAAAVAAWRPDALVTIDAPNFTLEVAKRVQGQGFPLIHYVAPTVWAWKPGRAAKIARFLDRLLVLLPFEPPYFECHGLSAPFVGHPAIETAYPSRAAARRSLDLPPDAPVLCVLPGSRGGEVRRHLPLFAETLALLSEAHPGLSALVPTTSTVERRVREATALWPVPTRALADREERLAGFAAADAALAASGTVALELAVARVPAVLTYRVNPLSAAIARRLIKVKWAGLPSLVLEREVQPELIQEKARPAALAEAVGRLLADPEAIAAQRSDYAEVVNRLGGAEAVPPSRRAARAVLEILPGAAPSGVLLEGPP